MDDATAIAIFGFPLGFDGTDEKSNDEQRQARSGNPKPITYRYDLSMTNQAAQLDSIYGINTVCGVVFAVSPDESLPFAEEIVEDKP